MACSDCFPGNTTVIKSGPGTAVTGSGTPSDPFIISVNTPAEGDWGTAERLDAAPDLNLTNLARPCVVESVLSGNGSVVFPLFWGSSNSGTIRLILEQDSTGNRDLDFSEAIEPAGGIALSTAPGSVDVVDLTWTGERWVATLAASGLS